MTYRRTLEQGTTGAAPVRSQSRRRLGRALLTLGAVGVLALGALAGAERPTSADDGAHIHGGAPDVQLLSGRSASPDDIRAHLRLRLDGTGRTHVMNMADVDHVLLAELTFEPGDLVNWHTHPGPVIVIVDEGVLTVTSARDCVARDYGPDEVYVEQGPGDVLKVSNDSAATTVIYALFFQVPTTGPLTIPEPDPGC